ncbi:hypothetical protein C8F04DRAFT_1097544 [Mycena alexandri]|uniref:Uncharacterized protein n=1 Tax=Mycena alexandri TaxID=1745969 RepID=A0AAD6SX93_9AGAR|nr:hypothetical protein C8F04DRAFT_1097544 [Mycena alexandri]
MSHPFKIFLQPTGTSDITHRLDVSQDTRYAPLRAAITQCLSHFLSNGDAKTATMTTILNAYTNDNFKATFKSVHGQTASPDHAMLDKFLNGTPPDVVLEKCQGDAEIAWGNVNNGPKDIDLRNEVMLLDELVHAFLGITIDPDPTHTPNHKDEKHEHHSLIIRLVYLHELQHAVMKFFFTSAIATPLRATPHFEEYLRFGLFAEWASKAAALDTTTRMWTIQNLIAEDATGALHIMDQQSISALIASFVTSNLARPPLIPTTLAPPAPSSFRCRVVNTPINKATDVQPSIDPRVGLGISWKRDGPRRPRGADITRASSHKLKSSFTVPHA